MFTQDATQAAIQTHGIFADEFNASLSGGIVVG